MTERTSDSDLPARKPTRSELGEMAWRGRGGRKPRVLAHGGTSYKPMALGEKHIYWADDRDGSITRLTKDGGVPFVLAMDQSRPTALALYGDYLYWSVTHDREERRIVRMLAGGGDIETIATGSFYAQQILVHGRDVYWTDCGDGIHGSVFRGSIDGAPPVRIASKQHQPNALATDGQNIFWSSQGTKRPDYFANGSIVRMPCSGGKKRWVIAKEQQAANSVLVDGEDLYWTVGCKYSPPYTSGAVIRRKGGTKTQKRIAEITGEMGLLAADATHIYCMDKHRGPIVRISKARGEVEELLSPESSDLGSVTVTGFAVDERSIYWTALFSEDAGGAVWKLPKSAPGTG